jgi:hypothetical protein
MSYLEDNDSRKELISGIVRENFRIIDALMALGYYTIKIDAEQTRGTTGGNMPDLHIWVRHADDEDKDMVEREKEKARLKGLY